MANGKIFQWVCLGWLATFQQFGCLCSTWPKWSQAAGSRQRGGAHKMGIKIVEQVEYANHNRRPPTILGCQKANSQQPAYSIQQQQHEVDLHVDIAPPVKTIPKAMCKYAMQSFFFAFPAFFFSFLCAPIARGWTSDFRINVDAQWSNVIAGKRWQN